MDGSDVREFAVSLTTLSVRMTAPVPIIGHTLSLRNLLWETTPGIRDSQISSAWPPTLLIHDLHTDLNRLDFLLFKQRFATLLANPGGDDVDGDVTAVAIDMDRNPAPFHRALAVDAPHRHALIIQFAR